jgi:choline dehydrogenase
MDYDYIVVGGGSSGCVTAGRLVRDHGARVLLLEAGKRDRHPLFKMPAGFIKLLNGSPALTFHQTIPQPQLDGRTHELPQGHVLGGGSTINGMVYMRGRPADYDEWDQAVGGAGWRLDDLLPHFNRQEGNQRLSDGWHGTEGPLKVSDHGHTCDLSHAFVETLQAMGVDLNPDFNGATQAGVGFMQLTTHNGRRCSATTAFLKPLRGDPKLTVMTECTVTRVRLEGRRAVGVDYLRNGRVETAQAANEIILTAGALITPKLLMVSGIGPAAQLRAHGLEVHVDLPGVGENLQDHHEVPVIAATKGAYGYFGEDVGWRMVRNGLRYLLFRSGPVSSNGVESCAFVNPTEPAGDPYIKLYCVPTVYLDRTIGDVESTHGVTLNSCLVRPKSRGTLRLRSSDPLDPPLINPNFLSHPDDLAREIDGLRYARQVLAADPLKSMIETELFPGPDISSTDDLAAHCRRTVKTNWHPVGTCRMGRDDDPLAVLTPELKVRGVEGLRVFDASLMPNIICGNTNAPVMAVADRAVDIMMKA